VWNGSLTDSSQATMHTCTTSRQKPSRNTDTYPPAIWSTGCLSVEIIGNCYHFFLMPSLIRTKSFPCSESMTFNATYLSPASGSGSVPSFFSSRGGMAPSSPPLSPYSSKQLNFNLTLHFFYRIIVTLSFSWDFFLSEMKLLQGK